VARENRHERVLDHGVVDLSGKHGRPSDVISALVQRIAKQTELQGLLVGIELPYMGHGPAANVITLRTLARLCGRWEQAFGVYGADVELVRASDWQGRILGGFGGKKRAGLKKAAKLWARGTFGESFTEDEADSVGIATSLLRERDTAALLEDAAKIQRRSFCKKHGGAQMA
jgi:hypothetical protein